MSAPASPGQRAHAAVDSPIGPLRLVAGGGRLAGLYMASGRHEIGPEILGEPVALADEPVLAAAAAQLGEYFTGRRTAFDLPLEMAGTPFQRTVWNSLRAIPYGTTVSYGELAAVIGRPSAARAVGLASGANPVSIVVPCHRVVGADGSLTGYGGGIERKRFLLALEQRISGLTLV